MNVFMNQGCYPSIDGGTCEAEKEDRVFKGIERGAVVRSYGEKELG